MKVNDNKNNEWEKGCQEAIEGKGYQIHCRDVRYGYGSKIVLADLDLSVRAGEFITLCGPSGCGKSTFLKLLLGEERTKQGIIDFDCKPRTRPDSDCGMVWQKYSVFPHMNALQNVMAGPLFSKTGLFERILFLPRSRTIKKQAIKDAREFLKIMGLENEENKFPHQLSGGQQQRLAIAQAMIMRPKVLLLDEPFTGLDIWTKIQLGKFIVKVWLAAEKKITIICVTHDLNLAILFGTRILVLSQQYVTKKGPGEGARIVADLSITAPHPRPDDFEKSPEFLDIQSKITKIAFAQKDGGSLVHIDHLLLQHPDSFQTTSTDEIE